MKYLKIFICATILLTSVGMNSQGIVMEKYNFGEGLNFTGDNGYSFKLSGYIQPSFETEHYTESDDEYSFNRFRMRRLRLRLDGASKNEKISYRLSVDLSGVSEDGSTDASNYLLDAFIAYNINKKLKVTFGQRSTYTDNRELYMNSNFLQLVERSRLTSAFSSIREFGLFFQGNYKLKKGSYLKPYVVVTNGDGVNAFNKDHGGLKVGGRLDYLPFGLFTNKGQFRGPDMMRENAPKLVIGANYSYNRGMSSRRGRESGSILYLNDEDEESLPDFVKYGADFLFKYQGFTVLGEYVKTATLVPDDITQRIKNDGSISTAFLVDGVEDVENYVKGRTMLGAGYNIQMGYLFKKNFSIDARYTHLEAEKHSFLNNGTYYNRPNYYTLSMSKYLARNYGAKIQGSLTYIDAAEGSKDSQGNVIPGNEWTFRLMLTLSI